jgi:two-component sensor histidine kinase
MLIVSELVSNAIEHARTASVVIVRRLTLMVHVIVIDGSSAPPLLQPYDVTAPRGRGLQMVDELAARWGWERHSRGKTVWASVELTRAPPLP